MRIEITGERGEGKTTIAVEIAKMLTALGASVHFETRSPQQDATMRILQRRAKTPTFEDGFRCTIVDKG